MRFVLALCVVVACTLCGNAMAAASRRRVRLLNSVLMGLKRLRLHMISMFEPLHQALAASGCAALEAVAGQMPPGVSAAQAWAALCGTERRRGGRLDALAPEDMRALDMLFDQLGESGRDQQELLIGAACAALEVQLEAARQRAAEADRLYVSLGALTGLMIALILL